MKIGLFFGSFNPIHIGHLIIANHFAEYTDLDQVWFVVTPHNPFKEKQSLLDNYQRLEMVHLATKEYPKLKPCDIEFNLPQPSYTINTLVYLKEKHKDFEFSLIMGEDNLKGFHRWKNYQQIIEDYNLYVYPRITNEKIETQFDGHPKIHHVAAPIIELSASFIRQSIKEGKLAKPMFPEAVWTYLDDMNFYK